MSLELKQNGLIYRLLFKYNLIELEESSITTCNLILKLLSSLIFTFVFFLLALIPIYIYKKFILPITEFRYVKYWSFMDVIGRPVYIYANNDIKDFAPRVYSIPLRPLWVIPLLFCFFTIFSLFTTIPTFYSILTLAVITTIATLFYIYLSENENVAAVRESISANIGGFCRKVEFVKKD